MPGSGAVSSVPDEVRREKNQGSLSCNKPVFLMGLNLLTTGQTEGRCSAEALSSLFFHSEAN